jgi:hypothetical protein
VFRGQAFPFGYNAPDLGLFNPPPTEVPDVAGTFLPQDSDHPTHLYLDTVHPGIVAGGWVALVSSQIDPTQLSELRRYDRYVELYPVLAAVDTAYAKDLLVGRSTRVTVDAIDEKQLASRLRHAPAKVATRLAALKGRPPEHIEFFPVRGTTVLVASQRIDLAQVPLGHSPVAGTPGLAPPVQGTTIELDRLFPDLTRGRTLLVAGTRVDAAGQRLGRGSEPVVVASLDTGAERTTVHLTVPMNHRYERGSVVIYGNVAMASHGESVVGERLGDGDAAATFQTFTLAKTPLTYVPEAGAPGGVASTLRLGVDGVRWSEVEELHGQPPDARVFVSRRDADGTTRVVSGDGWYGAALPSGRNNVTAGYRVGLGPEGNVGADSLRTLLKRPLGLKGVTNPAEASGGAGREDPRAVKQNAPGTVRTFGRIVSIRDFEDAAREYVGVAKARASLVWDGEARVVELVVAGDGGASVDVVGSGLRADLDARRDPHQPLAVRGFEPLPVVVRASIVVDDAHSQVTVRQDVDEALRDLLDFESLDLGQSVSLSDVYRAAQRVSGVVSVDVDEFRGAEMGEGEVAARLVVKPFQLLRVEDAGAVVVTVAGSGEEASR